MREIKFRAWDKEKKRWFYFDKRDDKDYYLEWSKYGWRLIYYTREMDVKYIYDFDKVQYTGLKDKNGKEIYEGDIIKWDEDWIYVVEWSRDSRSFISGFTVEEIKGRDDMIPDHRMYRIEESAEVIGNIYENPELIE